MESISKILVREIFHTLVYLSHIGLLDLKEEVWDLRYQLFLLFFRTSIYFVGTIEEARGKMIGTAITLAPLLAAKKAGYKWAILHTSKMGLNLYKRLGFKQYCTVGTAIYIEK